MLFLMSSATAHALATLVVVIRVAFVIFVVAGGALALRWPKLAFVHVSAVAWAVYVEWSGAICPVTPLENALRGATGLHAYADDFVATYGFPASVSQRADAPRAAGDRFCRAWG